MLMHGFVLTLSPFVAMTTSTPKGLPDYDIDSSTVVAPTCDSGEESLEGASNDIRHEATTAIANMTNDI